MSRLRACLLGLLLVSAAAPAVAQQAYGQGGDVIRLLREAHGREAAGDLAGAEAILRAVLREDPQALSALLSLERVLSVQGRPEEVLPLADALIAADPESAIGHQMLLRTYSAANRLVELAEATEDWVRASPRVETPYREAARIWMARGDADRAKKVLERGRDRLGGDALALELGDVYAATGEYERAVAEWNRAIGRDGDGFLLVRRRLNSLSDGGAAVLPRLIDRLVDQPTSPERRRAAAELAVAAGLGGRAESIARDVAADLNGEALRSFLVATARRADGAGLTALAAWAYEGLLAGGGPDAQMLAIRSRLAELSLQAGDTARARDAYRELEAAYDEGSPDRRRAIALRIELTIRDGGLDDALGDLQAFREEYPDAPELDALAAAAAGALLAERRTEEAERLLATADGPRAGLVRAGLALERGDVARAKQAFLAAAPALEGEAATKAISRASLLSRLSPDAGTLLGRAVALLREGKPHDAVALLESGGEGLRSAERSALLDFAAAAAEDAGMQTEAERVRRLLVDRYADAAEAPAALLALARSLAERSADAAEAQALLERLVLEYPRSALVPQARRELERLRARVPSS